jgi:hypothetical protein
MLFQEREQGCAGRCAGSPSDILVVDRSGQFRPGGALDDGPAVGKEGQFDRFAQFAMLVRELAAKEKIVACELAMRSKSRSDYLEVY